MSNFAIDINTTEKIPMTKTDCMKISSIVLDVCGIKLGEAKRAMIQSRLDRRLLSLGIATYTDYLLYLKEQNAEYEYLINALTTNKTEFWREANHFSKLMTYIEHDYRYKNSSDPLCAWSAACSTGEEVYTLAILLEEFKQQKMSFDYRILGSDIDTSIIKKAKMGIYSCETVKTVPPQYLGKYFYRGTGNNEGKYKAKEILQSNVKYRLHNLIDKSSGFPMKFDIIFLRNVLIYFDTCDIQVVISKLARHLKPGGYLFIGHSESLNGISHSLKNLHGSTYRKSGNE